MNTNFKGIFINTIKELKENYFIIPIFIVFFAMIEYFLLNLNNIEDFFMTYIGSFYSLHRMPPYYLAIIILYLLLVILLFTILFIYLLNKKRNQKMTIREIGSTYVKVLLTSLYLLISFGLILEMVKGIVSYIGYIYRPIGSIFTESISYYIISVMMFGVMYTIIKGIKIKQLSIEMLRYIFSKKTVYLLAILIVMNVIYYAIFGQIAQHYIQNSINILNFKPFSMHIWLYWIEWIFKGFLTSFVLVFVSKNSIVD